MRKVFLFVAAAFSWFQEPIFSGRAKKNQCHQEKLVPGNRKTNSLEIIEKSSSASALCVYSRHIPTCTRIIRSNPVRIIGLPLRKVVFRSNPAPIRFGTDSALSNPSWNQFPFVKSGLEPLLHKTSFLGFWVGGFNSAKEMHMECRTSSEQLSY